MSPCRWNSPASVMQSSVPNKSSPPSDWRNGCITTPPNCPAANSNASRWLARLLLIQQSSLPTSRPAISTKQRGARSSSCCFAVTASAAQRWCSSLTIPTSLRDATACCTCTPEVSQRRRAPHDAQQRPRPHRAQDRLLGIHGGVGPSLLAQLWPNKLSLLLRCRADPHSDCDMA